MEKSVSYSLEVSLESAVIKWVGIVKIGNELEEVAESKIEIVESEVGGALVKIELEWLCIKEKGFVTPESK